MNKRSAKKLLNQDQVTVRIYKNSWIPGYVIGDVKEVDSKIYVDVQTQAEGFLKMVDYRDLQ